MNLRQAAALTGYSEKTLRHYIKIGHLPATLVRTARGPTYDISLEAINRLPLLAGPSQEAALDVAIEALERVKELERILSGVEILKVKSQRATLVSLDVCGQLARMHGIGYWTAAKDWQWPDEDRADHTSVVRYLQRRAPGRFCECGDATCPCHAIAKGDQV